MIFKTIAIAIIGVLLLMSGVMLQTPYALIIGGGLVWIAYSDHKDYGRKKV